MPDVIAIRGARENNLQDVDLDVPKRRLTVFTGVSGSGKSSIAFDTIAAESQRLLNETHSAFVQNFLPQSAQPDADSLTGLTASIVVDQEPMGGNARSTVGTVTDAYAMLRRLWARLGTPSLGTPTAFSFNDPRGWCPACEGVGSVAAIDEDALVRPHLSLNEGAIDFPNYQAGGWYWKIFVMSGFFDPDAKVGTYTPEQRRILLHGPDGKAPKIDVGGASFTYEGLISKLRRSYLAKNPEQLQGHVRTAVERISTRGACPDCGGARLSAAALGSLVAGRSIAECTSMQVSELARWVRGLDAPEYRPLLDDIADRLDALVRIGLGYLSLSRESTTLSGGESQRVKMVRHLGSALTDVTYVFDEPSTGLHPHDVHRMNELLRALADKGNTVLVVEHKPEVIEIADHVVDVGPGAGAAGGRVVYEGDVEGLLASGTVTGEHMARHQPLKTEPRTPTGSLRVEHATLHNLHDVTVEIPTGVLVAVTGVAGSGKSSLVRGVLPRQHPDAVVVDQATTRGSRRSNPATYTGMADHVRKAFAKANGVKPALFSANSEGACPACNGLGIIYTDLGTLEPMKSPCETCGGRRFTEEVLGLTLRGRSIADVLEMSVADAREFFTERAEKPIAAILSALDAVGIGYLTLGQPLSTLSGGERQRLKLAIELGSPADLYVLDEPTSGLHMADVDRLIALLDRFVDAGSTVVVIEHNLDVVSRADHVLDMGPGAGSEGGTVVFSGPPAALVDADTSLTGRALAVRHGLVGAPA
ncbi:ATP-binding cassette domain-containing protein [Cellulomonas shaoxiangyii]|uniref:UvrABC system protein A n=1 Tax=Cellulomonas shaoxiangyii TaxID=2566013 RepID=A0A4P7SJD4_9CELL|nr:excinuclease ABC subunit UvrA [Cellulomonas shaoxiangyii]QCB92623.1 excinuclease ABC subunit UvrA [Cellulomonas shaoxiangyii]TGY85431.1 excinuclease ABC subunit UvrA [Cellulomonas shaoxiangyii]